MFGHIAETGQVVACELRDGNVPPSARNLEFFKKCCQQLPKGMRVNKFRADVASYQRSMINFCMKRNIEFAIRAKMYRALKQTISEINETDWQPVVYEDGTVSDTEWTARIACDERCV